MIRRRHDNGLASGVGCALLLACAAVVLAQAPETPAPYAGTGAPSTTRAEYDWRLPRWTPKPLVPPGNPMSHEKVELGRFLFYDKRMSINGTTSCATCHQQARAFTDGVKLAIGATGEKHPRNTMALANVAYTPVLTWANPLMTALESQALVPMFGEHPVEMGLAGKEAELLRLLRRDPRYERRFALAFPGESDPYTLANLTRALAAFQRTLVSFDSPYDRYRYGGDSKAIPAAAKRGERLFFSERLECFHCHGGVNFSDSVVHERLRDAEIAFHNTGLYNLDGRGAFPPGNKGLIEHSGKPGDMGRFRTPSLRNVAVTAPYMHDGSVATLSEAIAHYARGGRRIASGPTRGDGAKNPYKSGFVKGFRLTEGEKRDLIAFLESLTDRGFLTDPRFADPFEAPGTATLPASR
ncbi:MAG: MbnH family di-heme enzyme [Burkholderiales bacterium]